MSDFEKLVNASDLVKWIVETYPDWYLGAIRGIVDHIGKLPSAQPEPHWIPCSERLPEEDTEVLVCSDENNIEVASLSISTEIEGAVIWLTSGWRFGKVTAWMPLPKPYEEESE